MAFQNQQPLVPAKEICPKTRSEQTVGPALLHQLVRSAESPGADCQGLTAELSRTVTRATR